MKKIKIYSLFLILAAIHIVSAQVAIGKTTVSGNSSLLEFGGMTSTGLPTDTDTGNFRGIILPAVTSSPVFSAVSPSTNHPQNGTFLYSKQSRTVMMFENGRWINMTDEGNAAAVIPSSGTETGNGVIIGSAASSAKGVLVLESADKGLVLPHVKNPQSTVKSPYPGMMCYGTVSNSVAVYDGANWSYWK